MEYQPTIQDLKQVGYLKQEIKTLSEILDGLRSGALVSAKYRDTEIESKMLKVESIEGEMSKRIAELQELYDKILHWIFGIDDALIRLIFEEKYLNCRTWNQVADVVGGMNTEDSVKKMAYRYLEKKVS